MGKYLGTLTKYYKSSHWRKLRLSITTPKDCHCEICGKPRYTKFKKKEGYKKHFNRMEIHHLHYNTLGKEERGDLICLCNNCHQLGHTLEMMDRTRGGIFSTLYNLYKENTKWDYKKREK